MAAIAFGSLVIGVVVALIYLGASGAPFLLDDRPSILENPSLSAGPWSAAVWSPPAWSFTAGRPLLNWSFALSASWGGLDAAGFRWLNVVLHALNALLLAATVAELLRLPGNDAAVVARSRAVGFACGLLWAAHPVHTAAVTYVSQRAEVLMATFNLLTVLLFLRGLRSGRPIVWRCAVAAAFAAGVLVKESVVSAPFVCLLVDWVYRRRFAGGGRGRAPWWDYASFAPGFAMLAVSALVTALPSRMAVDGAGWLNLRSVEVQVRALGHYLTLAVWPHPLVFDRGNNAAALAAYPLWRGLVAGALAIGAGVAAARGRLAALPITAFFLLLAPTSSLIPVLGQPVADHRLYLPLGAVSAGLTVLLFRIAPRAALGAVCCLAAAFSALTMVRNRDYRTALGLWSDTVAKAPMSSRAHGSLGQLLLAEPGRRADGLAHLREALRLAPGDAETHYQLGLALLGERNQAEALVHFRLGAHLDRNHALASAQAALLLLESDRPAEALRFARRAVELRPARADFRLLLGASLRGIAGGLPESLAVLERLVGEFPDNAVAWFQRGLSLSLVEGGRPAALECLERATRIDPKLAPAWRARAGILAAIGGREAEVRMCEERAAALERGVP